ncbi:MAG: leucine-rich repeat protein [Clostridia bacterium]|nr:leucine-rich repeat protein [Clostridia bacterium]
MKKKIIQALSVMLAVVLTFTAAPLSGFVGLELPAWFNFSINSSAAATSGTCGDYAYWNFDESNGTLTISGSGAMKNYVSYNTPWHKYREKIVSVIINGTITSIGKCAFYGCSSLEGITVCATITLIEEHAFYSCSALKSINIPNKVSMIGSHAFCGCKSLDYIVIPDNITTIGENAFYGCTSLKRAEIGDGVTSIGDGAFYQCESLIGVTIPDSVISIGEDAFTCCTSLTSVKIGDSVTTVGNNAFSYCTSLKNVRIGESLSIIGDGAFYCCSSLTSVKIPDSVTIIGDRAFLECESLTSVTVPSSVNIIGNYAFSGCHLLTSLTIENGVMVIGEDAFSHSAIESVIIPDSVTTIGDSAFYCCTSLTSVMISSGVTRIGSYTFGDCISLINVTIPDGVSIIDERAFYNCTSLTNVTIPESVTIIEEGAFYYCRSLKDVYFYGTENQWDNIKIEGENSMGGDNYCLLNATIHFNCKKQYKIYFSQNTADWRVGDSILIGVSKTKGCYTGDYYPGNIRWEISNPGVLELEKMLDKNQTGAYFKFLSHGDCELSLYLDDVLVASIILSLKISEEELLNDYSDYLYNSSAFSVLETARDTCHDINFSYSKIEKTISAFFYSLENGLGVDVIAGEALAAAGLNRSMSDKAADKAMENVIVELMGIEDFVGDGVSKSKKIYKFIKTCGNYLSIEYYDDYYKSLAEATGYTIEQIKATSEEFSTFKKDFDLTFDVLEITAAAVIYTTFNRDVVKDMMGATAYNSAPYQSLNRIYQRTCDVEKYIATEFLSVQGVNLLSDLAGTLFKSIGGPTYDVSKIVADFACRVYKAMGGLEADKYLVALNSWGYAGYFYNYSIKENATSQNFDKYFSYYVAATKAALNDAIEISKSTYLTNKANNLYSYINANICYEDYLASIRNDLQNGNNIFVSNITNSFGYAGSGGGGIRSSSTYSSRASSYVASDNVLSIPAYIDGTEIIGIADYGFKDITDYQNIILPQTIKTIGNYAFSGCDDVVYISLNNGLTQIGEGAFYNCNSLEILSIPLSVTKIGNRVFAECLSLEHISFRKNVVSIGNEAFKNCVALKEICFENKDTIIPLDAFTGCENVTIYGYSGSTAQAVAEELGFDFVKLDKIVEKMEIVTPANKLLFNLGDVISTDGLTIKVTYADNSTEIISTGWSVACNTSLVGEQQVYICFSDEIISYSVTVNDIDDKNLVLSDSEITLFISDSYQLIATCDIPAVLDNLVWSSNNTNVATVSDEGYVSTKKCGTAVVTVSTKDDKDSVSCKIIVVNNEILTTTAGKVISSLFSPSKSGCYCFNTTGSIGNITATLCNIYGDVICTSSGINISFSSWLITDETYYVEFETTESNSFTFSISEEDIGLHTHEYNSFVVQNATCTEKGIISWVCDCGESYVETLPILGHNFVDGSCKVCGEVDPNCIPNEQDYSFSIQIPSRTEIRNKDGIILHANVEGIAPKGYYVKWESSNGNFDETVDGNNLEIIAENKGYTVFTAILCDADGNELARDSVEMYSKSGFFDKIGGFFRMLFGSTKIYDK